MPRGAGEERPSGLCRGAPCRSGSRLRPLFGFLTPGSPRAAAFCAMEPPSPSRASQRCWSALAAPASLNLALHAIDQGFDYIGDDYVLLEPTPSGTTVHSLYCSGKLTLADFTATPANTVSVHRAAGDVNVKSFLLPNPKCLLRQCASCDGIHHVLATATIPFWSRSLRSTPCASPRPASCASCPARSSANSPCWRAPSPLHVSSCA